MATTTNTPKASPRHNKVHYLQRETPLEPPVQVPRARPISTLGHARLLLWRELSGRWPLYFLLSLTVLIALLLPQRWSLEGAYFGYFSMLAFALAQGVGSVVKEEGFWAGLGGPPGLREVVPMATTMLMLTLSAVLVGGITKLTGIVWIISVALFAVVGFMRGWAATPAGRLLGALALAVIAASSALTTWAIGVWPVLIGVIVRLLVLAGVCFAARPLWASHRPAAAAGRKHGRSRWMLIGALPAIVGLVEVVWPSPYGGTLNYRETLLIPDSHHPLVSAQTVWRMDGESPVRTGIRGPILDAKLHTSGAIFYQTWGKAGTPRFAGLYTPEGVKIECPLPVTGATAEDDPHRVNRSNIAGYWVSDDGQRMTMGAEDGTLLSIDADEGCGVGSAPSGLDSFFSTQPIHGKTLVATDDWWRVEIHDDFNDTVKTFYLADIEAEAP
ncbi:MAG: hypothetical protein P8R54_22390 [Myxococcota bacterium]|nr:hypothetical protein [Myxococcota bacterium]